MIQMKSYLPTSAYMNFAVKHLQAKTE